MIQCVNNSADRKIGYYWERQFCIMAVKYGKCFTPHQWDKNSSAMAFTKINKYTLPDITIWSSPGEHHEIKHKNPTSHNSIGLELYRYNALNEFRSITNQDVYYTIHNHNLSGGRESTLNNIDHWFCGKINDTINIYNAYRSRGPSWVNGEKQIVEMLYWNFDLFDKLANIWNASLSINYDFKTDALN